MKDAYMSIYCLEELMAIIIDGKKIARDVRNEIKADVQAAYYAPNREIADMIAADVPITSVQKMLGHNSIHTTQLYVRVADNKVEKDYHAAVSKVMKGSLPREETAP